MGSLMGVSVPMQRIYSSIQRANSHRYPVLIVGESGTGKELVARSIHSAGHSSGRAGQPFVPVDCTALAPPLMEPELFGYAKDAFIGTPEAKKGLVRLAEDGTLFLREIAGLPLKLQAKLFHALQEHEFSPVGSTERFAFRARVVAATQRNLGELVAMGAFREDLYFHLSAVRIELPPLRARRPDIPLLASLFSRKVFRARRARPHFRRCDGVPADLFLARQRARTGAGHPMGSLVCFERGGRDGRLAARRPGGREQQVARPRRAAFHHAARVPRDHQGTRRDWRRQDGSRATFAHPRIRRWIASCKRYGL